MLRIRLYYVFFSSKSDFIRLYLRGFRSHVLFCLYLPSVCVFRPGFPVGQRTLFPFTKNFLLLLVCRCPLLTSISVVTHIQSLKITKVVERDPRNTTTNCNMWPLYCFFLYLNFNKPSGGKQENLNKNLVLR